MRMDSVAFLLIGVAIGFGSMYAVMKDRAPEIVRAEPVPFVPDPGPTAAPARPPVDERRIAQLRADVGRNPQNFDSLIELGYLYFEQQNFEEAVTWYGKALELQPNDAAVRTDMGTAMFNIGRVDDAIAEFRRSLQQEPTNPQALFNLGVVLLEAKSDKAGALENFEKLVAAHPEFPQRELVMQQIRLLKEQQP